jgi:hypothetical protein
MELGLSNKGLIEPAGCYLPLRNYPKRGDRLPLAPGTSQDFGTGNCGL